jgi:hypothetical protein
MSGLSKKHFILTESTEIPLENYLVPHPLQGEKVFLFKTKENGGD